MRNEEVVKIGVIGVGGWGQYHLLAIKQLERVGLCRLIAIAAQSEESVKKCMEKYRVQGYTDYKELFNRTDLDAITIATPDHLHREIVLAAIEAGLHVFVEKPLDLSVEGCEQIVKAAEKAGVMLHVDFHKRYDPYVIKLRELVTSGVLGEIEYAYAYMEDRIDIPKGMKWAQFTDPYWFLGVHKVDALRWILGQEVKQVIAYGHKNKLRVLGVDTYDDMTIVLRFDKGTVATVHVSWVLPASFEGFVNQGFRFVGTEGIAEVDTQDRGFRVWDSQRAFTPNLFALYSQMQGGDEIIGGYYVQSIFDFVCNVYKVKQGTPISALKGKYPDGLDGLRATQIGLAVHESILSGRPIKLANGKEGCNG